MDNEMRDLWKRRQILVAGGAACFILPLAGYAKTSLKKVTHHPSDASGFYANTYVFEGEDSYVLIDAHLTADQGAELVSVIEGIGKPLEAVVITHPHPDHYRGLEVVGPAFPDATILSSERVLKVIRDAATDWPGFRNSLRALSEGTLRLGGREFECILPQDAESIAPVVLFETNSKTLVAGDHVLQGQHLWLAEMRLEAWRENLAAISKRWPIETVLPGHGAPGSVDLLEQTDAYLGKFLSLKNQGATGEDVRMRMLDGFPDHLFDRALDMSILAHFGS